MFESIMEEQFEITKQLNRLSYPRMTIKKNDLGVTVHHMAILTKFSTDPNSHVKCPTGTEFLSHDKEDAEVNKTKLLRPNHVSYVSSTLYAADILMLVTFMATESENPQQKDYHKAMRILN